MEWTDDEIRNQFDDWFEQKVDEDLVDEKNYRQLLVAFSAGFRQGLDAV